MSKNSVVSEVLVKVVRDANGVIDVEASTAASHAQYVAMAESEAAEGNMFGNVIAAMEAVILNDEKGVIKMEDLPFAVWQHMGVPSSEFSKIASLVKEAKSLPKFKSKRARNGGVSLA